MIIMLLMRHKNKCTIAPNKFLTLELPFGNISYLISDTLYRIKYLNYLLFIIWCNNVVFLSSILNYVII